MSTVTVVDDVQPTIVAIPGGQGPAGPPGIAGAGVTLTPSVKTSNYTSVGTDNFLLANATSAPFTITLPSAGGFDTTLIITSITTNTNLTAITAPGTETISGVSSITLGAATSAASYQSVVLASDNSNWWVIDAKVSALLAINNLTDVASAQVSRANLGVVSLVACKVVATSNISLSGLGAIDTYTPSANDRILTVGQTVGSQNGVWLANASAWTRPSDYASGSTIINRQVLILGGSVSNTNTLWSTALNPAGVVGTTATSWYKIGEAALPIITGADFTDANFVNVSDGVAGVRTDNGSFQWRAGGSWHTTASLSGGGGAPLNSPAFTGIPTAPTASAGTNTTQLATTAFVIGQAYAPLASPAFTGTPTAPTVAAINGGTGLATTGALYTAVNSLAPLASPNFTGTPIVTGTPPTGTASTTQLATTAFVQAAISAMLASAAPQFQGAPTLASNPATADSSTKISTTAYVQAQLTNTALLGTPTAPTPTSTSNNTTLATTAFVKNAVATGGGVVSFYDTKTIFLSSPIVPASGNYPSFFITLLSGYETAQFMGMNYIVASGVGSTGQVVFNILRNGGAAVSGVTATGTSGSYSTSPVITISNGDLIALQITAVTNSPPSLTCSLTFEYTVT